MREFVIYYIMAPMGAMMYAAFIGAAIYSLYNDYKHRNDRKEPVNTDDDY